MDLSSLLKRESVMSDLTVGNKKQVLKALAVQASEICGIAEANLFELLLRRERLGSTAIGGGIAIPHAKVPGIDRIFATLVRLKKPTDFEAQDGHPVDIVIALFAPEGAGADHLKALAKIARSFNNEGFVERLRACHDQEALVSLLLDQEASAA